MKFHVYVTLIQDIKDLIIHMNTILHTLREGNNYADFLTKMRDISDSLMTKHASPLPKDCYRLLGMGNLFFLFFFSL